MKELTHEYFHINGESICLIELNNPKKLNCLSMDSWLMLRGIAESNTSSAIVLTAAAQPEREAAGKKPLFCAGFDLDELTAASEEVIKLKLVLRLIRDAFDSFQNHTRPVLAFVDGDAFGGGMGLVTSVDYVLATERSHFQLPQDPRMMALAGTLLPLRRKGLERWDGLPLDAQTALKQGLVNEVIPPHMSKDEILKKTCEVLNTHFKSFSRVHLKMTNEVIAGAKEYLHERKAEKEAAKKAAGAEKEKAS